MTVHDAVPTPYPEINVVLDQVLSGAREALGTGLAGMYLYGSLAGGDFNPRSSDIDFLVVTEGELADRVIAALKEMHDRIAAGGGPWTARLEGAYIPRAALRRYDPARARHPTLGVDGGLRVEQHHSDWIIQRHVAREQGVVVAGPPPSTMIDSVSPGELQRAVVAVLDEWWSHKLDDTAWLDSGEYQAFAILTMCRALYTLHHGAIVSKTVAARWARTALGSRWEALIEHASAWQRDARWGNLNGTLDFIRYTLAYSRQFSASADDP